MIGPRRHDRYLLQAFWATFAAVLLFLTVIVLLLDLSDRLARLGRGWGALEAAGQNPYALLAEFYATLVPFLWLRLLPFAAPLAAALCLSRLVRFNELTALLAGGVSKRRLALPILASGAVVAGAVFWMQESVAPRWSRRHNELMRLLGKVQPDRITEVPHLHDPGGGRLSMEAFRPLGQRMENVQITFRGPDGEATAIYRYPELAWAGGGGAGPAGWVAPLGGVELPLARDRSGLARVPIPPGATAPLEASLTLVEISITSKAALGMSLAEVRALRAASPASPRLAHMEHALFTGPISAVVLLLLALPFAFPIGRRNPSPLPGILGAGGVGALYFAGSYLTGNLAAAGDWNPVVLSWLPTVVFGTLGLSLFLTMDAT